MSKTDFEKMAHDRVCMFVGGGPVVSEAAAVRIARDAFNAGLDRAAEIAEGCLGEYNPRERWYENPTPSAISTAIRAEREKS